MDMKVKMVGLIVREAEIRELFEEETLKKKLQEMWDKEDMSGWVQNAFIPQLKDGRTLLVNDKQAEYLVCGGLMAYLLQSAIQLQIEQHGTRTLKEELIQVLDDYGAEIAEVTKNNFIANAAITKIQLATLKRTLGDNYDELFV